MKTLLAFAAALALTTMASGQYVDLEWRAESDTVAVGDILRVGLYAVADNDQGADEPFVLAVALLHWEPAHLLLVGTDDIGPYYWWPYWSDGFVDDSGIDGLNDTWLDGNANWQGWAGLGDLPVATPDGLLLTTFEFIALAPTPETTIWLEPDYGTWSHTAAYDDEYGGWNIVDELGSAVVEVVAARKGSQ